MTSLKQKKDLPLVVARTLQFLSGHRKVIAALIASVLLYTAKRLLRRKYRLEGKICLITGGGSGIGRLMSRRFADLGSKVVVWDINKTAADNVVKEINAKHGDGVAVSYQVNLADREAVYAAARHVIESVGFVEVLVNNAGIVTGKTLLESSDAQIQATFDVNVLAHFWTIRSFLPAMLERDQGYIVNIASSAGFVGVPKLVDYCSSKFAAIGLHEALTMELRRLRAHINTSVICPYYINTGMFDGASSSLFGLLPVLDPEYVVDSIISGIQNRDTWIILPPILYAMPFLKSILPDRWATRVLELSGASSTMDQFKGARKQQ